MEERKLLEDAAKAAGIEWSEDEGHGWYKTGDCWAIWNPLTSDADAFRLAVALRLNVDCMSNGTVFVGYGPCGSNRLQRQNEVSDFDQSDSAAATRRAIVRAAAAIGAKGE